MRVSLLPLPFLILGASFVASTGLLIHEFQGADWQSHGRSPTATCSSSFRCSASWRSPPSICPRWSSPTSTGAICPTASCASCSASSSWPRSPSGSPSWLDGEPRAIWEVSPGALAADQGDPPAAAEQRLPACPILATLANLREAGQRRVGLSKFRPQLQGRRAARGAGGNGEGAPLLPGGTQAQGRGLLRGADAALPTRSARLQADPAARSLSALARCMLPAAQDLLRPDRHRHRPRCCRSGATSIDQHYRELVPAIERGVIIGAFAMLLWPIMDYGYQQTANVLFGALDAGCSCAAAW